MESLIQALAVYALPLLFGITLHEAAHGYVARYFGDKTAEMAGRISLNPVRHIDPIGTIAVPLFILVSSTLVGGAGMLFGWAKPVPVNWSNLRNPKKDILWVAAAGPASNLLMAVAWAILFKIMHASVGDISDFWLLMAKAGVQVNLVLMALNLLPIPPLDGGRIVYSLLPYPYANQYARLEPYGMIVILVLMVTGVLGTILQPFMHLGLGIIRLFL